MGDASRVGGAEASAGGGADASGWGDTDSPGAVAMPEGRGDATEPTVDVRTGGATPEAMVISARGRAATTIVAAATRSAISSPPMTGPRGRDGEVG